MLPQGEKNYKTVKMIKYKTLSLNLFKPNPNIIYIKEPHPIHLTKFKVQLEECKVEQLLEQDQTAKLVSKFSFSFEYHIRISLKEICDIILAVVLSN